MANKKINELSARVGLANNDLLPIGDPDNGTLYNTTVQSIAALVGASVAFAVTEVVYVATGSEGLSVSVSSLINATIGGVYRGSRLRKVLTTPTNGQVKFTTSTGTLEFGEALVVGELVIIDKITM